MLEAVIFDMDGVLINTEPFWRESEIEVFGKAGVTLTDEMCLQTAGLRLNQVVEYWYNRTPWNKEKFPLQQIEDEILDRMEEFITSKGEPMEGVLEKIEWLSTKDFPLAIATASPTRLLNAVLNRLNIKPYFTVTHSAEFEPYGKPHPAVYLSTAKMLKVNPINCIVIEDSVNGVIAGKAANMKVIAVPETINSSNPRFAVADKQLNSLIELNDGILIELSK